MAKITVTALAANKIQIECDDVFELNAKISEEIQEIESSGVPEDRLDVICAVKRWLFDHKPLKVEIDTKAEVFKVIPIEDNKWGRWIEAFQLFAKYSTDAYVCAEHDEVFAGAEVKDVSPEDEKRLEELGWIRSTEGGYRKVV